MRRRAATASPKPAEPARVGVHGKAGYDTSILSGEGKADRIILIRGDVDNLPCVVAVPEQYGLSERLHVSNREVLVGLRIKQTPVPSLRRLPGATPPGHHPAIPTPAAVVATSPARGYGARLRVARALRRRGALRRRRALGAGIVR